MSETLSLKSLLVPSKSVEVEFPGFEGFKVTLNFLSRETLVNIRKKSTKTTFKNRQPVEELDDKLFLKLYVAAAIKGWSGFKYKYLNELAPSNISEARHQKTPASRRLGCFLGCGTRREVLRAAHEDLAPWSSTRR